MAHPDAGEARDAAPDKGPAPEKPRRFPRLRAAASAFARSRVGVFATRAWARRRPIAFGLLATGAVAQYVLAWREMYVRDYVWPDTYLVWKVYDGSIVDARAQPTLGQLVLPPTGGEEQPRVMELFEVLRTLKWAQQDRRVRGIVADFSQLHVPASVAPQRLGLAQIEELMQAVHEFRVAKREQFGPDARPTIAWTDTFSNQGSFLLASAFDRVYMQPTGTVPLVGLSSQVPFFRRLLGWLGIRTHAEARNEYKSMVSPFTETESLTPAQLQNQAQLLGELNRGYEYAVGVNRFPAKDSEQAADTVAALAQRGPLSAREAEEAGLIDGRCYKRDIVRGLMHQRPSDSGDEEEQAAAALLAPPNEAAKFKSLYHYAQINQRQLSRTLREDEVVNVGIVYLLGTISSAPGPFSVSNAIRGLREAAADKRVRAVVLRIDSGGGDVVASESMWDAVRRTRTEFGKPVIVSFGNAAASGGYYVATAADAIFSCESTITGSIGVAALRPTITKKLLDRLQLNVQSFFTGSSALSALHELDEEQRDHMRRQVDDTYADFLGKVRAGRKMSDEALAGLASGRVMTGLTAWALCNPTRPVEQLAGPGMHKRSAAKEPESALAHARRTVSQPAASLLSEWHAEQQVDEAGTTMVYVGRAAKAAAEAAETSDAATGPAPGSTPDSAPSDTAAEESPDAPSDDADKDQEPQVMSGTGPRPLAKTPYGRGLVDTIGGLWDSAFYAMALSLKRELKDVMDTYKVTPDEAALLVRPRCRRTVSEDGNVTMVTDLRLVRYPEEKSLLRRLRQYSMRGDQPLLSELPQYFSAMIAQQLLRLLGRYATDPAALEAAFGDADLARQLRDPARMQAEYPFNTRFV